MFIPKQNLPSWLTDIQQEWVHGGGGGDKVREKSVSAPEVDRKRKTAGERESKSAQQSAEWTGESPLLSVTTPPCDQWTKWNKALEVRHVVFCFILLHHHSSSPLQTSDS